MTDLGVTHLAPRQSDRGSRGPDQGVGVSGPEAIPDRGRGGRDRIVFDRFARAPSIEDQQHCGADLIAHVATSTSVRRHVIATSDRA
jgi:hypothetical protein